MEVNQARQWLSSATVTAMKASVNVERKMDAFGQGQCETIMM
jgi:hypothetical protein